MAKEIVCLTVGRKARSRLCPMAGMTLKRAGSDRTDKFVNYTRAKRMTNVHSQVWAMGKPLQTCHHGAKSYRRRGHSVMRKKTRD